MDDKKVRECVIRWINYLVDDCCESDAEMVASTLGIMSSCELRSIAHRIIGELEERGA